MTQFNTTSDRFPEVFKNFRSSLSVASPGRINLIGEHTDYNMGFVLPTAIDKRIYLEFAENSSETICNIYSNNLQDQLQFDLKDIKVSTTGWHNYILGTVVEILKRGRSLKGFNCILNSDIPFGAGISSSAALECGIATGLNELFQLGFTKYEIVELSMQAEHNYVGNKCGIMDQFASVMSRKESLLFLDCRSLEVDYIPLDIKNCKILLLNSLVSHQLAETEYNTRRMQCEEAVMTIRKRFPEVSSLRDVSLEQLEKCAEDLTDTLLKRAGFVIEENSRVCAAVDSVKSGNLKEVGTLMYQSHHGLQTKYEVSCPELDFLVNFTRDKDYIYGSRMMGGGFGGCTINLIEEKEIDVFVSQISEAYFQEFGKTPEAFSVLPSEGTTVTKNEQL